MTSIVRVAVNRGRKTAGRAKIATTTATTTVAVRRVRPRPQVSAIERGRSSYATRPIRNREENPVDAVHKRVRTETVRIRRVRCISTTATTTHVRRVRKATTT